MNQNEMAKTKAEVAAKFTFQFVNEVAKFQPSADDLRGAVGLTDAFPGQNPVSSLMERGVLRALADGLDKVRSVRPPGDVAAFTAEDGQRWQDAVAAFDVNRPSFVEVATQLHRMVALRDRAAGMADSETQLLAIALTFAIEALTWSEGGDNDFVDGLGAAEKTLEKP